MDVLALRRPQLQSPPRSQEGASREGPEKPHHSETPGLRQCLESAGHLVHVPTGAHADALIKRMVARDLRSTHNGSMLVQ